VAVKWSLNMATFYIPRPSKNTQIWIFVSENKTSGNPALAALRSTMKVIT
jgi:hypothetical protein